MPSRSIRIPERRSDALARGGPDDLARARASRDLLLRAARVLVAVIAQDADLGGCRDAGCAGTVCPDRELSRLAHRLADVESAHTADPGHGTVGLGAATGHFEAALTEAIDAVRRCRQTEHRLTGHCWFAADPDHDGCGEILRAVHGLG